MGNWSLPLSLFAHGAGAPDANVSRKTVFYIDDDTDDVYYNTTLTDSGGYELIVDGAALPQGEVVLTGES